ncbi:MAG: NAD(P)H-dependent oxidoreductase subunit E [Mariprofundaceae bacterium]
MKIKPEQTEQDAAAWTRAMLYARAYPPENVYLLAALEDVQTAFAYVPPDSLDVLAGHFGCDAGSIEAQLLSFGLFSLTPPPAHQIRICQGPVCMACGGKDLFAAVADLNRDEDFSVISSHCLGMCDHAPVMKVDDKPVINADLEQLEQEITALKS